jgi:hypothetical protein
MYYRIIYLLLAVCCTAGVYGQDSVSHKTKLVFDPTRKTMLAEASCGLCQFGMSVDDCKLAVRIKGKAYEVDGAGIDDFGDAHAADGFCQAVRRVQVQGTVVNDRFRVTWLKLLATKSPQSKALRNKRLKI